MDGLFDHIIGNDKLKAMLHGYIASGRLPHALIVEGPRGSGRKTVALSVAASMSCTSPTPRDPCMTCDNCVKIFHGTSPDVITIDSAGKASIGVDRIRELRTHTYISANELETKTYIIDEAEKMTREAQNALLKILEEPVTDIRYFLICENADSLLPTIRSRAPVIRTQPLKPAQIAAFLRSRCPSVPEEKQRVAASESNGCAGVALSLCDDSEESRAIAARYAAADQAMSLFSDSQRSKFALLNFFSSYSNKNEEQIALLRLLYRAFRDIIAVKVSPSIPPDYYASAQEAAKIAAVIKPKHAKKMLTLIEQTNELLSANQGASSVGNIMTLFSIDAWTAIT